MDQGRRGRSLNTSYSLRRQIVPSKRFEDFYLERKSLSKKKDLQTEEEFARKSGEALTCISTQTPLPGPSLCEDSPSYGDKSSALPQHFPASSLTADNGWESTCKVSEAPSSTVPEASECVGHKSTTVAPHKEQAEQGLGINNAPLVLKLWSSEQKSVNSHAPVGLSPGPSHEEPQQSSQTPRDSSPQAPKVKKAKVAQRDSVKQRLEIAAMVLQLAQNVPALIPEAKCTIDLQKELLRIQKCGSKRSHSTSAPQKRTSEKVSDPQEAGCDTKRCKKTVKPSSTGKHCQKRKHDSTLDSGPVMGPERAAARAKEDTFFPHLQDSSLMAEAKERKRRELPLESSLRQAAEPLEERYIKNADVLPDLRLLPPVAPSPAQSNPPLSAAQSEPLLIHGHAMEDYKATYHSVVDPMLSTRSGSSHRYNLGMGRAIKQRLWEQMSCPTLVETVDADGQVHISETFSTPPLKSYAPHIDVDISGEPLPGQPKRKRARQTF